MGGSVNGSVTVPLAALWGLTVVAAVGCASIAGLDDLVPAAGGTGGVGAGGTGGTAGGGTAGSGTGGGTGGSVPTGGAGVALAEWTVQLDAVYFFENPLNVGYDSAGSDQPLVDGVGGVAVNIGDSAPQLESVLELGVAENLVSTSPHFHPSEGDKFTWGGWFLVTALHDMPAMTSLGSLGGYELSRRDDLDTAVCAIADGMGAPMSVTATGTWPVDVWTHVVCRYDGASSIQLSILVNGSERGTTAVTNGAPQGGLAFTVGAHGPQDYLGQMDELFFAGFAATDDAIRRIWACGIDGRRCACEAGDEPRYADCGRAESECLGLPFCNDDNPGIL